MRIDLIGHASLLVRSGRGFRCSPNPWWDGPAYHGASGHPYPFPVPRALTSSTKVDAIHLTHGHEDHTHEPTLRRLTGGARVVTMPRWYDCDNAQG